VSNFKNILSKFDSIDDTKRTLVVEDLANQKPIPVVQQNGNAAAAQTGFLNISDTSPTGQAMQKAFNDLTASGKAQVVLPQSQTNTTNNQQQTQQVNQQNTQQTSNASPGSIQATGSPMSTMNGQQQVEEEWDEETETPASKKGMFDGKSKAELKSAYNKLKASGPHKQGSPEFTKMKELAFAIRAKGDWGKVEEDLEIKSIKDKEIDLEDPMNDEVEALRKDSPKEKREVLDKVEHDMKESIRQIDEISSETATKYKDASREDSNKRTIDGEYFSRNQTNRLKGMYTADQKLNGKAKVPATKSPVKENSFFDYVNKIEETITKKTSAGKIISDFEDSKNHKFKGKSKEKRKDMALGAYYGMHPEKSEKKVNEVSDETLGSYVKKASVNSKKQSKAKDASASRNEYSREGYGKKISYQDPENKKATHKERNRDSGISLAVDKLTGKAKVPASKKLKEADPAPTGDDRGAGLGAGRSDKMLETKGKKMKKKVNESMSHKVDAARLEGKSHGLKGHAHCGKNYDDPEHARAYHEGYKEGLDECYGMMDEGNAFTAKLAQAHQGDTFSLGGHDYTDTSNYDDATLIDDAMFESWEKELNAHLNEGISVSVNKGNTNASDSVTITATDHDADNVLDLVRNAGLGIFGKEESSDYGSMAEPTEMGNIDVVGDPSDIMNAMRSLSSEEPETAEVTDFYEVPAEPEGSAYDLEGSETNSEDDGEDTLDFIKSFTSSSETPEKEEPEAAQAGEESEDELVDDDEELCGECGVFESDCQCDDHSEEGEEKLEETENEYQREFEVAEDADGTNNQYFGEDEEELTEWANDMGRIGTEQTFEQDIDFMTKVISGGLNKPKSTGQEVGNIIPVSKETQRGVSDDIGDWRSLAGIKHR